MSLPPGRQPPAAQQLSIRSFFRAKAPNYAPPPRRAQDAAAAADDEPEASKPPLPSPRPDQAPPSTTAPATTPSPSLSPPAPAIRSTGPPASPPPLRMPPKFRISPEAEARPITPADISALRRINALLLPVSYPDSFYDRAADPALSGRFSRLISWTHAGEDPQTVGAIVCRLEPAADQGPEESGQPQSLYIQSLCLLSPYRGKGLIAATLDHILHLAVADTHLRLRSLKAHVWTENEEGLHWYNRRGFARRGPPIQAYYLKLRPGTAWLVERHIEAPSAPPSSSPAPPPPSPSPNQASQASTAADGGTPATSDLSSPPPPASAAATSPPAPPPSSTSDGATPPGPLPAGQSYQKQRPAKEWNDLPDDMAPAFLLPPGRKSGGGAGSEPGSNPSSRSSSAARKKRDRSYPAAAFGS